MSAPMLMTDCPTAETLAAYVDDRLDAATRLEVTKHIASCGDCREHVNLARDYQMSEPSVTGETPGAGESAENVVRGKFGWVAAAGLLAAAASLALILTTSVSRSRFFDLVLQQYYEVQQVSAKFAERTVDRAQRVSHRLAASVSRIFGPDMDDVFSAYAEGVKFRPGVGRLGRLPYRASAPVFRSDRSQDNTDEIGLPEAKLYAIAADAKDPHVRGLALLLTASNGEEFKDAVRELEAAYAGANEKDHDEIATNLVAALLAYDRWTSAPGVAERAFELSDSMWKRKQTPEVAFNRAMALEALNRKSEAIAAWNQYLKLDKSSPWAAEARTRKADLNADP